MSGLPLEFLNQKILLQLAAVIGKPVKIDEFTLSGTRGKYAKVCVLLDLKKPIEQGFWGEAKRSCFFQTVAYENLLNICFNCGKVEHQEEQCSVNERMISEKEKETIVEKTTNSDEKLLGSWIQIHKRNRKFSKGSSKNINEINNSFVVLNNPACEEKNTENSKKGKRIERTVIRKMKISKKKERGAGKKVANEYLRDMVFEHIADMVLLQKTHMVGSEISNYISKFWRNWEAETMESNGRAGGLLLLWRRNRLKVKVVHRDDQSMCFVVQLSNVKAFLLTGVYASTNKKKMSQLWDLVIPNLPWPVVGDLNCVNCAEEKERWKPSSRLPSRATPHHIDSPTTASGDSARLPSPALGIDSAVRTTPLSSPRSPPALGDSARLLVSVLQPLATPQTAAWIFSDSRRLRDEAYLCFPVPYCLCMIEEAGCFASIAHSG
ncbi:hypothetical protein Cni_G03298 [Canna indica]|uniref:CCHC-type domain-containing protein n=1 Tax=Canna indica TaxID=4628 RepID=A0AAQ3JQY0_9LILI|nr:hypothetical protein Cni_G03298 [Canna indica]